MLPQGRKAGLETGGAEQSGPPRAPPASGGQEPCPEHHCFPQVKFEMSEETTLADLLQLNLHNYEDEVRNIVDKAVKESGMEKVGRHCRGTGSARRPGLAHWCQVQRPRAARGVQAPSLTRP